ncbi:Mis12 protein-domain-containing protein [Daldinia decipiens]|uniref:Mis12 protein-domain-containing protein n=1 Tax=Daldinia decipiens TaxID=326647 RepID=UPI0020C3A173|nr:Mis12 protein-domain-containing protein [Daldinia decipiens]KAI1655119.1 Mis12 protein-domain-containing protein [Daldinia decipiens]
MTTSTNSDAELLTEHFGYPPISLIDDIINSVNVLAERALNSVEQGLLNAPPATIGFKPPKPSRSHAHDAQKQQQQQQQQDPAEAAKTEIESGTHQLETLLCASIDRNFDKFEIYVLRNILTVRPPDVRSWIRLSHYDGLDFSTSSSTNLNPSPTLDSINHLRRKLRESMRLNALLTAERARNEKLLGELQDLVGIAPAHVKSEKTSPQPSASAPAQVKNSPFAFLHRKGSLTAGGSEAPLSTTTAFTLSQMQALRALSTSLRIITPDLVPSTSAAEAMDIDVDDGNKDKERKSWRRERLEYVEGATRRYLETVEGLELGRHGEVRDGEWQGAGRGLARDEVGGLEGVITLLGGEEQEEEREQEENSPSIARRSASSSRDDRMDES